MSSASCDPQPDSGENQTAKYNEVNGIKVVLQNIARHYPESKTIRIAVGFIENIVENHRAGTSLDALIKICRDLKNVEVTISEEKPSVSEVRRLLVRPTLARTSSRAALPTRVACSRQGDI